MVTTPATKNIHSDGAIDYVLNGGSGSSQSSATNSPPSPAMPLFVDGANDTVTPRSSSPFLTGSAPENHYSSQYQYSYTMANGVFHERSQTPQACV
jgi:hypothetical protein